MEKSRTSAQRSYNMSRVRSSKTTPELKLKPVMKFLGFRYQPKGVIGRPDFADKKRKVAVFIDGCFWHGCAQHYSCPSTNVAFWTKKKETNRKRDLTVNRQLKKDGWTVIRIWTHELK